MKEGSFKLRRRRLVIMEEKNEIQESEGNECALKKKEDEKENKIQEA